MKIFVISAVFLISALLNSSFAQDNTDTKAKYLSWAALQLLPSPVFIHDGDENNNRVVFGLRWQVTPVNISFRANKFVSPVQFFMINPVRKFTGSAELFVQPEWAAGIFKYSRLGRFGISAGTRITFPVSNMGESIAASIGGKYNYRNDFDSNKDGYWGLEGGVYFYYGIVGLQFNYNFDAKSKYNAGIYFKFF